MQIATAPVSWGVLMKDTPNVPPYATVLDGIRAAGYSGTELGPFGYLPLEPDRLRADLAERGLHLLSAFVPIALRDDDWRDGSYADALATARFLATLDCEWIVVSDALFVDENRARRAGRIRLIDELDEDGLDRFARNAERLARRFRDEFGLKTVMHPHVGGYLETPREVDALMSRTDPDLVGLCLDTGHAMYGGDDPVALHARWPARVRYLHLKDCDRRVLDEVRARGGDYYDGVRSGVFPELGRGSVDFAALLNALRVHGFAGWGVVEQDILPGQGIDPSASARRNLDYLRALGA